MSVVPLARTDDASYESGPTAPSFAPIFGLAVRLTARIAREIRVRRDMRRLAEFDEFMLRDIGIVRSDIEGAVRRGHDDWGDGAAGPGQTISCRAP